MLESIVISLACLAGTGAIIAICIAAWFAGRAYGREQLLKELHRNTQFFSEEHKPRCTNCLNGKQCMHRQGHIGDHYFNMQDF